MWNYKNLTTAELEKAGAITSFSERYKFLSNFWLTNIPYDDMEFSSVEHAYVYAKLRAFKLCKKNKVAPKLKIQLPNEDLILNIWEFNALHPGQVKKIGRRAKPSTENLAYWDSIKFKVMKKLLKIKFKRLDTGPKLMETGDAILIEGNTWGDKIWGMVDNGRKFVGDNMLGILLMERRAKLLEKEIKRQRLVKRQKQKRK